MAQTYTFVSPQAIIARNAGALYGISVGTSNMASYVSMSNVNTDNFLNTVYVNSFGPAARTVDVADLLIANLGITGATAVATAKDYVVARLNASPVEGRGAVVSNILSLFSGLVDHPDFGAAAIAWNAKVVNAINYATVPGNVDTQFDNGAVQVVQTNMLTIGQDRMFGTAGDDTFTARIINNGNTLQSGDYIQDSKGIDALKADIGNSQAFAITPETVGIENVAIRAEAVSFDSTDNNTSRTNEVQIDAQRMQGVTNWEDNNSRADLLIEDVRINDGQITKDITITMRETDPGHVDYGVYFDQYSLRAPGSNTGTVTLKVHNTLPVSKGYIAATPLNSAGGAGAAAYSAVYTGVSFDVNGVNKIIPLDLTKVATYDQLNDALQAGLTAAKAKDPSLAGVTITQQKNTDTWFSDDGQSRTTDTYLVTVAGGVVGKPTTSGWAIPQQGLPADNTISAYQETASTSNVDLVTSTIILDDVGRGSMGGDLVIGGLSVGDTSLSKGVQRFEIEVQDNSKLQSINSTNNTLREVTIKNGLTDHQAGQNVNTYVPTLKDKGNLTVTGEITTLGTATTVGSATTIGSAAAVANGGTAGVIGGVGVKGVIGGVTTTATVGSNNLSGGSAVDAALPGTETVNGGDQHNGYGFNDVRLIDASAMTGKLNFTAAIGERAIDKYLNLGLNNTKTDSASLPVAPKGDDTVGNFAADNNYKTEVFPGGIHNPKTVGVEYIGGTNNDTMAVDIDPLVAGSRSKVLVGREDFSFKIDGGAGNDQITVRMVNTQTNDGTVNNGFLNANNDGTANNGGYQDWYNNQDLNNNVTVLGGDGNDMIRTLGAGDKQIDGGTGNDVIYTDNTGYQTVETYGSVNPSNVVGDTQASITSRVDGIWVYNTTDQVTFGSVVRDINDLRSDINDSYNLYRGNLVVTFKGIPSAGIVIDSANYKTSDLQINQAIKAAINNDATLNKLLVAEDGPANSLVVRSLIDGFMTAADLGVAITAPTSLSATEVSAAGLAYGIAAPTDVAVLAAMNASLLVYAANGDYNTAMATTGPAVDNFDAAGNLVGTLVGGVAAVGDGVVDSNTQITGVASVATTDNLIMPGVGNDVVVLSTTEGVNALTGLFDSVTSSNETIRYGAGFGNDVVVNFTPATTISTIDFVTPIARGGNDHFDFKDIGGTVWGVATYATDKSINVELLDATLSTAKATIEGLYSANNAAAQTHVYVAVSGHNVGSVYTITDAAGASNAVATLQGTIDLASTSWFSLAGGDFVDSFAANYFRSEGPSPLIVTPTLPTITLTSNAPAAGVNEGGAIVYTATSSTVAPAAGLSIPYALSGTAATDGTDYTSSNAATGTIAIPAGATTGTLTLTTVADALTEGAETVGVNLTNTVAGYTVNTTVSTATINDTSTAPVGNNVAVGAAGTSAATAGVDTYTVAAGNYAYTISGGFAAGDKIGFPAGQVATVNNTSFTDGAVDLQWASNGQVVTISLTGLANATDQSLNSVTDFNTVFGAGTIF